MEFILWDGKYSAFEKQMYLDWGAERFAKTVYFTDGKQLYGVVLSLDKKVDLKEIAEPLGLSKRQAAALKLSDRLPYSQMRHSAGPFISREDEDLVEKIIFMPMTEEMVDFSFPGRMDLSIHVKYIAAAELMKEMYKDKIILVDDEGSLAQR